VTDFEAFWTSDAAAAPVDVAAAERLYATSALPLRSRCAPLAIPGLPPIWIKRDDELSFGVSGTKLRKYASLLPALTARGVTDAVVLGGRNSNNVLAAAQLLTEVGIVCHLLLRAPEDAATPDTVLDLVRQLVPDERITHVPRDAWAGHAALARDLAARLAATGRRPEVVPEGASRLDALPGAVTLGIDVRRNEAEVGRTFRHVVIEAGTGLSAVGLALGLVGGARTPRVLHVVCTSVPGKRMGDLYRRWTGSAAGPVPQLWVHVPAGPPPASAADLGRLAAISRATGVLFDPLYAGRSLQVLAEESGNGWLGPDTLLVHTGGMGLLTSLERRRMGVREGAGC
jgi:1-aminocyclopropane-1-carboxylate deaminase/D-cysteine desulfhydrase-like pyridoxal-dependent ACC family enzyme